MPSKSPEDPIEQEFDQYFSQIFNLQEPGGAIAIVRNDTILYQKGFGIADLETGEKITPNTLFNLGSISKTFVANGILLLQEAGKLSVEDNLIKYFPEFKHQEFAKKIKIKHLLTHTSGLPDNRQVADHIEFYLTALDAENWHPVTQTDTLMFAPGTQYEYSNPAFNGLALIIEKVSGKKWQEFIIENIMKPAGMLTSTITDGPHPESGVSHGYVLENGSWQELDYGEEPTFPAAGNGGVWSSVRELINYENALQNASFLKPETIKDSRTIKTFENWQGEIPPFIGWSWFIEKSPTGLRTVGHTGSQGGFLCNYVTVPEKGIHFVILCNTPRDVDGMTRKIFEVLGL
ncbi:MAG: beta-lactamase family protein [Saprospiraceae bacterium]|nr:beta-lactamase family protein [Saprospiraceae bacterium]